MVLMPHPEKPNVESRICSTWREPKPRATGVPAPHAGNTAAAATMSHDDHRLAANLGFRPNMLVLCEAHSSGPIGVALSAAKDARSLRGASARDLSVFETARCRADGF